MVYHGTYVPILLHTAARTRIYTLHVPGKVAVTPFCILVTLHIDLYLHVSINDIKTL